jgi:hypothetical protein
MRLGLGSHRSLNCAIFSLFLSTGDSWYHLTKNVWKDPDKLQVSLKSQMIVDVMSLV